MRRFILIAVALIVSACAYNQADKPRERYAIAAASYQTAVEGLTTLGQAGKLSLETAEKAERARLHARAALDAAERLVMTPQAEPKTVWHYVSEAARLVVELVEIERAARGPPR